MTTFRIRFIGNLLSALCLLPLASAGATSLDRDPESYRQVHLLFEAIDKVKDAFVDSLTTEDIVRLAIDGVMEGLDPHSRFLGPEDFAIMRANTSGSFYGIGVVMAIRGEFPMVVSPMDGTPAKRAGVRAGDRLVGIDGVDMRGKSLEDAVRHLRGELGEPVTITIERPDGSRQDVPLTRAEIHLDSVSGPLYPAPDVAYIRISRFTETTGDEFVAALDRVDRERARGLVLDLRANPGGLLSQAVRVAERFVEMGDVIVEVRSRTDGESRIYRSGVTRKWRLPVSVLVDEGSASAAEIVAGALQDHRLATVVGTRTFGKGSVQSIFAFDTDHALKLTTARYFTPSGRSVEPLDTETLDPAESGGIHPDVSVESVVPDSLSIRIVSGGFTADFVARAPLPDADLFQGLGPDYISRFREFVASASDIPVRRLPDSDLDLLLREEMALQASGEVGALEVRLRTDPSFRSAVSHLNDARDAVAASEVGAAGP